MEIADEETGYGLPMLQLSNGDMGLGSIACKEDGPPAGAAALFVALYDTPIGPPIGAPRISPFPPDGLPSEGEWPCGPGRYSQFTVKDRFFMAWLGIGDGVSSEDRATLVTSFETMSAIPDWEPVQPDRATPTYVIAGGASQSGEVWRLELRPDDLSPELSLEGTDPATLDDPLPGTVADTYYAGEVSDPIFGAVTKAATGVEFRPGSENTYLDLGESPVPGTIAPVPPMLGSFDFDLFFIDPPQGYAELGGHVIALGVDHLPSESPLPVAQPRGDEVELAGEAFGQQYRVRFTGAFADETACIRVTVGGELSEPQCPRPLETSLAGTQPSMHGVATTKLNLLAGSVPPEIIEIRFTSDDGTDPPTQFQCQMGPLGWTDPDRKVRVMALPAEGSGIFQYLDADGGVLFEEGMSWGVSEAEAVAPMPVDPVQFGTYWAAYAWLGSGAEEDQIEMVQRQLQKDHGVRGLRGSLF